MHFFSRLIRGPKTHTAGPHMRTMHLYWHVRNHGTPPGRARPSGSRPGASPSRPHALRRLCRLASVTPSPANPVSRSRGSRRAAARAAKAAAAAAATPGTRTVGPRPPARSATRIEVPVATNRAPQWVSGARDGADMARVRGPAAAAHRLDESGRAPVLPESVNRAAAVVRETDGARWGKATKLLRVSQTRIRREVQQKI